MQQQIAQQQMVDMAQDMAKPVVDNMTKQQ